MNILILGATGRSGKLVLSKAIQDGHKVTAIVREPSKLANANATIIEGSPYDPDTVKEAIRECDAVISTLNVSRTSDNPWAKLRAPKDLISKSIQNVLDASQNKNLRIICLGVLGGGDSWRKLPIIARWFIALSNLRYAFWDHSIQEEILSKSETNWTVLRMPMLTDAEGEMNVRVNNNDGVKLKGAINRESVARFALNILNDPIYFKSIIGISN